MSKQQHHHYQNVKMLKGWKTMQKEAPILAVKNKHFSFARTEILYRMLQNGKIY